MSLTTLVETGASNNRVDIVFLGDGYTAQDQSTYLDHINGFTEYLFSDSALTDPFHTYQNFFNIHMITVYSNESGVDDPASGITRDTALGATYRYDGVTDRLLYVNQSQTNSVMNDALAGTGIDPEMRLVTTNSTKYGGGGGYYSVYAGGNSQAHEVALHELGHSFAGLADEYYYSGTTYSGSEPNAPNSTTDPTGSKWSHWFGYVDPILGEVGAYEGSSYAENGAYRPTQNSKMRSLNNPFDPIAKEAFILEFYAHVDPLDDWAGRDDGLMSMLNPDSLWVDPIDADVIDLEWSINGTVVAGDMLTFTVNDYMLDPGQHTISARAYDATGLVRRDLDQVEQTVSWLVTITEDILTLLGSLGDDVLIGTSAFEEIDGLAGDDVFETRGGSDIVRGGSGRDKISYAWANERVSMNLTKGEATTGGETDKISEIEIAEGTPFSDILIGSQFSDELFGLDGDDLIEGAGGDDLLDGGTGNDTFFGGNGNETHLGGLGDDTSHGGAGNDLIHGGAGNDKLYGDSGDDTLNGNDGDDELHGGLAEDTLHGSDGQDRLYGGDDDDMLCGNADTDELYGQEGNDAMRGGMGDDFLFGGEGNDRLFGGPDADVLNGGAGDDKLTGSAQPGIGDGAADVFVFAPKSAGSGGRDKITDFEDGLDLIDFTAFGFVDFESDILSIARDSRAGLKFNFGQGDQLLIEDFHLSQFDVTDVVFAIA